MEQPIIEPLDPYPGEILPPINDPNPLEPVGAMLALAAGGALIYFILMAGMIALGIWIWYSVTWRAVRRGLHEFHHSGCSPKLHRR